MEKNNLTYIIDDDTIVLKINNIVLNNHPKFTNSKLFEYAEEALNEIKEAINRNTVIPNLILLDLNMPVMDGWNFLEALSENEISKQIPVAILTSSIDPRDIENIKRFKNVIVYLSKPLNISKLDAIHEMMIK